MFYKYIEQYFIVNLIIKIKFIHLYPELNSLMILYLILKYIIMRHTNLIGI